MFVGATWPVSNLMITTLVVSCAMAAAVESVHVFKSF